ncbi:sugar ABC transporter ATP-binding protein [Dyadobacter psychrotolerans]|uniref:Sugar ABC transporter ATP-binding protein n=1 Tax=Dyadobacter psychrotolerans TaxID=2541721 RepID=A0A4R5DGD9_9BACT|nr:sugar ABC transporter ATP-binding protein [Dyadobacter psychrotolerans]TDE12869.1 sugar ABC transporter ATP-binding protein [Dyadobacter psychrotolerans]
MSILQITNLTKSYSGIKALDNVQLSLKKGEVHALMGENGAGKSTLMKILVGLTNPDSGQIVFNGNYLGNKGVNDKLRKGISMIDQEILIIPELTVAQNIFLGREKEIGASTSGWLRDSNINSRAKELLSQIGLEIGADVKMKHLSVAQMQMVEIAKAISNEAQVIIMDEPTSAISDKEVSTLFRIIRELKSKGVSVIYTSHKMDEIFEIADTVTVLRDGNYIGTKSASELDKNALISMMVGRDLDDMFPERRVEKGQEILSVKNLSRKGKFSDISFEVHAGEILGLAGLMGAGRTEIARVIYGMDQADSGDIFIGGKKTKVNSPRDAVKNGIGYVSEDRKGIGFIPALSVKENMTLASLSKHRKGIFINTKSEKEVAEKMIIDLRIKVSGSDQKVMHLSGGNQQKVVIAKVLLASPKVIILDEPTRGIDIGAKFEIYKLIQNLAAEGIAVILISSELPEILGMSDRILVLSKGRKTAMLSRHKATQEMIMKYAVE